MKKTAERSSLADRQALIVCLLLAAVTLLAFSPIRHNQFLDYDDQQYITENPKVLNGVTWEGVTWAFTASHSANWHPVTWLSHMVDVQLFGVNPVAHHFVNVLIHIANAMLLFLLLFRMTGALWRGAVVAFLFALHPMHVESVAWAAERKDVLSTLFGLLGLLAYWKYTVTDARLPGKDREAIENSWEIAAFLRSPFYWISLGCFAGALMSKPMLVTLPGVMLLLDLWPLRRWPVFDAATHPAGPGLAWRALWRLCAEKIPYLALVGGSAVITMSAQQKAMMFFKSLPFSARLANAAVSYLRYLEFAFWPKDLAVLYPHPMQWPATQVAVAVICILGVTIAALGMVKRRPYVAVGWFWYLGMLVPVLGIVQVGVQSMADRYSYLPLVGIFIIAAWGGADLLARTGLSRNWSFAIATGVLVICAVITFQQVRLWRDTRTLFIHTAGVTTRNWFAEYKLAVIALRDYEAAGRTAIADQISQDQPGAARSPAAAREALQDAIRRCQLAIQWDPRVLDVHLTLAKALTESGRIKEAEAELRVAVQVDPKNPDAHANLAEILYRQGQIKAAVAEYQAALDLNPEWQSVLNNLAWILATDHNPQIRNGIEAVRLAEKACKLADQTNMWFQHTRAAAYAEQGNFSNAVVAADLALQLAKSTANQALVNSAVDRLNLYRESRPLRAP